MQTTYRPRQSKGARVCAVLLALGVLLASFQALNLQRLRKKVEPAGAVAYLKFRPTEVDQPQVEFSLKASFPAVKPAASVLRLEKERPTDRPHQDSLGAEPVTSSNLTIDTYAPRPAEHASAPLRLDSAVVGAAAKASKSEVRKMADLAGKELNAPRPTKDEVMAAAIADAAVPGCLRPDALKHDPPQIGPIGLSGVLALPLLGRAVLTGKCK